MSRKYFVFIILLMFTPLVSFAGLVPNCGTDSFGSQSPCGLCQIFELISNIFKFIAFSLTPPIAGLLILVAGVLFLTSAGSEKRVEQAKEVFKNLVIGLIIVYVSFLLVNTLINVIGKNVNGFEKKNWNTFNCL